MWYNNANSSSTLFCKKLKNSQVYITKRRTLVQVLPPAKFLVTFSWIPARDFCGIPVEIHIWLLHASASNKMIGGEEVPEWVHTFWVCKPVNVSQYCFLHVLKLQTSCRHIRTVFQRTDNETTFRCTLKTFKISENWINLKSSDVVSCSIKHDFLDSWAGQLLWLLAAYLISFSEGWNVSF